MFEHFLITRFNLRNPSWTSSRSQHPVLSEAWLQDRFQLFEQYCLPSVAAQTEAGFSWLVYFDTQTPEQWLPRIERYHRECPQFQPVFVDGMPAFLPDVQARIAAAAAPYVITSRLDNDDCISSDFIARVQEQFAPTDFLALDFIDGYMLEIAPVQRLGRTVNAYNPFVSLIERNREPLSVWHKVHAQWKREPHLRRIRGQRIWLTVIHQDNKTNEFRGFGRADKAEVSASFVLAPAAQQIWEQLLPVTRWRWLSLKNRLHTGATLLKRDLKKALGLYRQP
ncbi:glycosyltransferase [Haliea sp. E1-2-M8]|uniref:glycosyltransferase n=1 Tax=Haliea sp. E1-2-M8 TaxID=3064706 RepID=UPI00271F0020|nr:glycosyltransferase [Haliea sp. E1-2-M8]MDO8861028.1 glycosyltransferase [Haliea sp. E1-2-M8]